jgi:hypothetical protein
LVHPVTPGISQEVLSCPNGVECNAVKEFLH